MSKQMGKKMKGLRKGMDITQEAIASKLNVDRSTYSNYERGITEPDVETIIKLSKIFNVSTDELLGREEEPARVADSSGMPIYTLSKEEKEFLISLRVMNKEKRSKAKDAVKQILSED